MKEQIDSQEVEGERNQKLVLGHRTDYLVDFKLDSPDPHSDGQTDWSGSYGAPIIGFNVFYRAKDIAEKLGCWLEDFRPIINAYSSAHPEIEHAYLLEKGLVVFGESVKQVDDRSHRIILRPKGERLDDLKELARELELPTDFLDRRIHHYSK